MPFVMYPAGEKPDLLSQDCKAAYGAYRKNPHSNLYPASFQADSEWSQVFLSKLINGESVPKTMTLHQTSPFSDTRAAIQMTPSVAELQALSSAPNPSPVLTTTMPTVSASSCHNPAAPAGLISASSCHNPAAPAGSISASSCHNPAAAAGSTEAPQISVKVKEEMEDEVQGKFTKFKRSLKGSRLCIDLSDSPSPKAPKVVGACVSDNSAEDPFGHGSGLEG